MSTEQKMNTGSVTARPAPTNNEVPNVGSTDRPTPASYKGMENIPAESLPMPTEDDDNSLKVCRGRGKTKGCGETKSLDEFRSDRSICKACYNADRRAKYAGKTQALSEARPLAISPPPSARKVDPVVETEDLKTSTAQSQHMTPNKIITELLGMCDAVKRVKDEPSWLAVGKAFYNTTFGNEVGLTQWREWTLEGGGDDSTCEVKYRSFHGSPITVKTVAHFARQDNFDEYAAWFDNACQSVCIRSVETNSEDDLGKFVYRVLWLDVVYANKVWYYFSPQHGLVKDVECLNLHRRIREQIVPVFQRLEPQFKANLTTPETLASQERQEYFKQLMVHLRLILRTLTSVSGRKMILEAAKVDFNVPKLDAFLDCNPYLLGVANGVIELTETKAYPREERLEDFVVKRCKTRYNPNLTVETPIVKEMLKWLNQLFPDTALFDYARKWFASLMLGHNAEKLFTVMSGTTNAGKSTLIKLLKEVFDTMLVTLPQEILQTKRGGSGPSPEMAQLKGARIATIPEGDAQAPLSGNKIKMLTGNDEFFARMCREDGGAIKAMMKVIMQCNDIPTVPDIDAAVLMRFLIIPFLSQWVNAKDAPATVEEQYKQRKFPMDPNFERDRVPLLAEGLLWLMVHDYQHYKQGGLVAPEIVKQYTANHWKTVDVYRLFIAENLAMAYVGDPSENKVDMNAYLTATIMYPTFKLWYKNNCPSSQVPDAARFKTEMLRSERLGQTNTKSRWVGVRISSGSSSSIL